MGCILCFLVFSYLPTFILTVGTCVGILYILYSSSGMDDWDQIQKVSVFTLIPLLVLVNANFTVW